jgi:hypothetical protein
MNLLSAIVHKTIKLQGRRLLYHCPILFWQIVKNIINQCNKAAWRSWLGYSLFDIVPVAVK